MRKFIVSLFLVVGLAGLSYAAVEVVNGTTKIGKTETLNIVGPSITSIAGAVSIDASDLSTLSVDGAIYAGNLYSGGAKRVVCVNATGYLYASATTVDCN